MGMVKIGVGLRSLAPQHSRFPLLVCACIVDYFANNLIFCF